MLSFALFVTHALDKACNYLFLLRLLEFFKKNKKYLESKYQHIIECRSELGFFFQMSVENIKITLKIYSLISLYHTTLCNIV